MNEQTELLREIRDLFRIVAEPALAKRNEELRAALRAIVGKSGKLAKAVYLMDGTRTQGMLIKQTGIDPGNLSRSVKALRGLRFLQRVTIQNS
jgi:DNA-binding MarR family transcriptional regulator